LVRRTGSTFQYAEIKKRGSAETLQHEVEFCDVPREEIYPEALASLRVCPLTMNAEEVYIKRPCCLSYDQDKGSQRLAEEFLKEAQIHELLSTKQHGNLPRYHGCLVEDGRVVGIVMDRYASTLRDQRDSMDHASCSRCFSDTKAGLEHLHSLGLAHNDLNPANIMADKNGNFVIIDFDSCAAEDVPLTKIGTPGWNEGFKDTSSFANDNSALERLKEYLEL
jgi:serine/threonine protein kinase